MIVLMVHDRKAIPKLKLGLTLNAIISILATVSKSTLVLAVGSAISQLKWHWFQTEQGQATRDLQLFDDASRGPWGSFIFLCTRHIWSAASAGAIVTILLLAFDPFFQQVLEFPNRDQKISSPTFANPKIPRAQEIRSTDSDRETFPELADLVKQAVWADDSVDSGLERGCPVGNCAWTSYKTLGICATYTNTTNDAQTAGRGTSFNVSDIPGSGDLTYECSVNLTGEGDSPFEDLIKAHLGFYENTGEELHYQLVYPTYAAWQLIDEGYSAFIRVASIQMEARSDNHSLFASRCQLVEFEPCVKEYSLSFVNGELQANLTGDELGQYTEDGGWTCLTTESGPGSPTSTYALDLKAINEVRNVLRTTLVGVLSQSYSSSTNASKDSDMVSFNITVQKNQDNAAFKSQTEDEDFARVTSQGGPEWVVPRLLTTFERAFRDQSDLTLEGSAYISQSYVNVRWVWLIFPVFTVLTGSVFLLVTIWICRSTRAPVWKTSSLALLFHGFDPQSTAADVDQQGHMLEKLRQASATENVEDMENLAASITARLQCERDTGILRFHVTDSSAVAKTPLLPSREHTV